VFGEFFKNVDSKPTRPRHTWEDIVRMIPKEISGNIKTWVDSVQDRDYWRAHVNPAFTLWIL
jgi:hypothetical protein